ncbi:unnamed protein product [Rotaria magnacalcarata]|uniref:Uncharacterized protein n=1 Tax=Rotaria magnacalcarata TaxID=392030 RepID=A0A816W131_9BILA|nr:unnamed protein product [Rotaria magnacalcarata]CAF4087422.1 unnamed protein product [Rotaria magnacalcarata]
MTGLLLDNFRKIEAKLKSYTYPSPINSCLGLAEQKTGLKREQLIIRAFGILMIYLVFGWGNDLVCNFIGLVYPTYASLLAVEVRTKNEQTQWLVYWMVYASFSLIEYSRYTFIHTLRGYWLVKCIFLIWLMLSGENGGAYIIYRRIIYRFLFEILQLRKPNPKTPFYNESAGESNIEKAALYDKYGNPVGRAYDLGRDGSFTEYNILIGQLYLGGELSDEAMQKPIDALKVKGFQVKHVRGESAFLSELRSKRYQIAWVISTNSTADATVILALTEFHSTGGGIFLFADNIPYISPASEFLNETFGVTLTGYFHGSQTLTYKENGYLSAGNFGQHYIFTGIKHLFEGVTICHPVHSTAASSGVLITVATATDGNPNISLFDPPTKSTKGRLCLDCGFTKLFINWDDAGTKRYIVNVSCWLTAIDKKS